MPPCWRTACAALNFVWRSLNCSMANYEWNVTPTFSIYLTLSSPSVPAVPPPFLLCRTWLLDGKIDVKSCPTLHTLPTCSLLLFSLLKMASAWPWRNAARTRSDWSSSHYIIRSANHGSQIWVRGSIWDNGVIKCKKLSVVYVTISWKARRTNWLRKKRIGQSSVADIFGSARQGEMKATITSCFKQGHWIEFNPKRKN